MRKDTFPYLVSSCELAPSQLAPRQQGNCMSHFSRLNLLRSNSPAIFLLLFINFVANKISTIFGLKKKLAE